MINPQFLDPAIRDWPFEFDGDCYGHLVLKGRSFTWEQVCHEPLFQDAPYKFETDEQGNLLLSPATNRHGFVSACLANALNEAIAAGRAMCRTAFCTPAGVKVADVAWISRAFLRQHGLPAAFAVAPELLIEVVSPSNSAAEMDNKTRLYLEAGAHEVWLCDLDSGAVQFFDRAGQRNKSLLAPEFPARLELEL